MGAPTEIPHASPSFARGLLRGVPTALVLAGLGGAAYWGHATGWNFGKKAAPAAEAEVAPRPRVHLPSGGEPAFVEFASAAGADAAGVGIALAWPTDLTEQAVVSGEVGFDPTRVARVSARAPGVAHQVRKAVGDPVRAGDMLALVAAAEVGKAKAEFQQALAQVRLRERSRDELVAAKAVSSAAALREAEAALKEAEVRVSSAAQLLTNFGLPIRVIDFKGLKADEVGKRLRGLGVDDAEADGGNLYPLRAPFAGVVLTADVVRGEVVEAGKPLFVVADPSRVWVTLHVNATDAARARVGQKVLFRPDGERGEFPATVVWVGTTADETTRTVPIRCEADNAGGSLRASALGRGRVVFREVTRALVVPHGALHTFRGETVVFVRHPDFQKATGPKRFTVRAVKTGGRDDTHVEILAGLSEGDVVANARSGELLTELERAAESR